MGQRPQRTDPGVFALGLIRSHHLVDYCSPALLLHSWKMNAGYLQSASMDQLTQLAKMTS